MKVRIIPITAASSKARRRSRRSMLYMLLVCHSSSPFSSFSFSTNRGPSAWSTITTITAAAALTAQQQQQPIRKVVVAGGTHGNEYTGVWCVHHLEEQDQRKHLQKRFPSLTVETVLANPEAFHQNRRFVDTDLNREFALPKLNHQSEDTKVEAVRARQLNAQLGPKEDPKTELVGIPAS